MRNKVAVDVSVGSQQYGGNIKSDSSTVGFYDSSRYNSDYDAIVNEGSQTGVGVFGENLYPMRARIYGGIGYLPSTGGTNLFTTPDSATLDFAGDVEFIIKATSADWTPSANMALFGKRDVASNYSFQLLITTAGALFASFSVDGTAVSSASGTAMPLVDGTTYWFKITRVASTGLVSFFYSTDGVSYTASGTNSTTSGAIFAGTSPLNIGLSAGGNPFLGSVAYASIASSIGGVPVVVFDPSAVPNYAYGWRSSTGEDWSVTVSTAYQIPWQYKVSPAQLGSAGFYTNARVWGGVAYFPSGANYVRCPDSASLSIVGDIELGGDIFLTDWTPAAATDIICKWGSSGQFSYSLEVTTGGNLLLAWTVDGTNIISKTSTVALSRMDGTRLSIKATLDVDNGAGGNDVKFYTSQDNVNWNQLGATVTTAGVTSIFDGNSSVQVSGRDTSNGMISGGVFSAYVKNGINGTTVATFNPSIVPDLALSWTDAQGNVWTITKTTGSDTNDPTRLVYDGTKYVYTPGTAGNYISTPDSAVVSITGDLELVFYGGATDWTAGTDVALVSKWGIAGARSYYFKFITGNQLQLSTSADGTATTKFFASTAIPSFTDGQNYAVKVELDVDDGAGNSVARFYTSTNFDITTGTGTWVQLGATVTSAGTTSLFDSTQALMIASRDGTNDAYAGKVGYAYVKNGIGGTTVAKFDASLCGQTGYTDSVNSTVWTVNRSTTGKKSSVVDRTMLLFGVDDYVTVENHFLISRGSSSMTYAVGVRRFSTPDEDQSIMRMDGSTNEIEMALTHRTTDQIDAVSRNAASSSNTIGVSTDYGVFELATEVIDRTNALQHMYQSEETASTAYTVGSMTGSTTALFVGRAVATGANYIDGEISGFAVVRRALRPAEVGNLVNQLKAQQ